MRARDLYIGCVQQRLNFGWEPAPGSPALGGLQQEVGLAAMPRRFGRSLGGQLKTIPSWTAKTGQLRGRESGHLPALRQQAGGHDPPGLRRCRRSGRLVRWTEALGEQQVRPPEQHD
jgi:hypothetical protein